MTLERLCSNFIALSRLSSQEHAGMRYVVGG